ncbi:MAG: TrbI/VirB10 family protein [Betaproteobacteria bacterium]
MSDPNASTKRRQLFVLGIAVVGILGLVGAGVFLFDTEPPQSKQKPKTVNLTPPGTVDDKDVWRANEAARQKANEGTLNSLNSKVKAQEERIEKLSTELANIKQGKPGASKTAEGTRPEAAPKAQDTKELDERLPQPTKGTKVLQPPTAPPGSKPLNSPVVQPAPPPRETVELIAFSGAAPGVGSVTGGAPAGPEVLGFPVDERAKKVQHPKGAGAGEKRTAIEFIPAGSFVRVAMLNGVDAPTGGQAQGNPLPMAFQVLDTANLANKYKLDIRECRFVAAAWGDLSSERTMGRTESLTCIIEGEVVEMPVKGVVIGEDGKAGIRGRLVTKQGQLLANALFAGTLSGIGQAIQASSTIVTTGGGGVTTTIDPNKVAQAGLGGGVAQAANMLAAYYIKAADKLFPVIETDGGRVVEILVTKGATFNAKTNTQALYRGLMSRNGTIGRNTDD